MCLLSRGGRVTEDHLCDTLRPYYRIYWPPPAEEADDNDDESQDEEEEDGGEGGEHAWAGVGRERRRTRYEALLLCVTAHGECNSLSYRCVCERERATARPYPCCADGRILLRT
eukprot:954026-Rhodomonas_salina.2